MASKLPNVTKALKRIGELIKVSYKFELFEKDVDATGKLSKNIVVKVKVKRRSYQVSLQLEDYWKYIEYGRRPGKFPPIDEILNWITVKPVPPIENSLGQAPSERSLAFLISRKIAKDGIEGKHLLEASINEVLDVKLADLQTALQTDVQDIVSADLSGIFTGFKHITFK